MNGLVAQIGRWLLLGGGGLAVGLIAGAFATTRRRQLVIGAAGPAVLLVVGLALTIGAAHDALADAAVTVVLVLNGVGFLVGMAVMVALRRRAAPPRQ